MADTTIHEDEFSRVVFDGQAYRTEPKPVPGWRRALGLLWRPFCSHSDRISFRMDGLGERCLICGAATSPEVPDGQDH